MSVLPGRQRTFLLLPMYNGGFISLNMLLASLRAPYWVQAA